MSQRWNDPKSQLQQCCLTLRQVDGSEPDIPEYKTIAVEGPTNTRLYKVAVYFRYIFGIFQDLERVALFRSILLSSSSNFLKNHS